MGQNGHPDEAQLDPQLEQSGRTMRIWFGAQPRTKIPVITGFQLLAHERLRIGQLSLVGLLLMPLWFVIYVLLVRLLGGPTGYGGELSIRRASFAFVIIAIVIILHEGIHGLAALGFGNRPHFGIGPGFFFMTVYESLGKFSYLTVALAPLVIISAGSVILGALWPAAAGWALFGSLFNISGAGGDLWMAKKIHSFPRDALFIDLADGFAVVGPTPMQPAGPSDG